MLVAAQANDFFTRESLLTFQGSTLAVLVVSNVAGYMFGQRIDWLRKWLALVFSLAIQLVVAYSATQAGWEKWVIAVLNGLLVFSAAMGLNEAGSRFSRGRPRFFASWLDR